MSSHDEELHPQRRDLNLSDVVRQIRDDGPAPVVTETPERTAVVTESDGAQGLPAGADADSPPRIVVEPLSGGAARTHKRRGFALAASAAVVVVILGLALFFAGAGVQVLPSGPWDNWLPGASTDQRPKPHGPVTEVPRAVAAISREENERIRQIQTLVAEGNRVNKERIATLEEQVEQTRQAQTELAALARRLEIAARKAREASVAGADAAGAATAQVATDRGALEHARRSVSGRDPRKVELSPTSIAAAPINALTAAVQSVAMKGKKSIAEALVSSADEHPSASPREAEPEAPAQTAAPSSEPHVATVTAAPAVSSGDIPAKGRKGPVASRLGSAPQHDRGQAGPLRTTSPQSKQEAQADLAPSEAQRAIANLLALPAPKLGAGETAEALGKGGVAARETASTAQRSAPVPSESRGEAPAVTTPPQPAVKASRVAKTPASKKTHPKVPDLPDPFSETDSGGTWVINLVAMSNRERAEAAQRRYQEKGFPTDVAVLRRSGSRAVLFGVEIPGFSTREDAAALVPTLKAKLGIKTVWIHQYR